MVKKTAAPADPDDIGAKLDRIIELLERQVPRETHIVYRNPYVYPVYPTYPYYGSYTYNVTSSV